MATISIQEVNVWGDGEYHFPLIGDEWMCVGEQLDWAIDVVAELASHRSRLTFADAKERIGWCVDADERWYGRDERVCGEDHFIAICARALRLLQSLELDIRTSGTVPGWFLLAPAKNEEVVQR